MKAHSEAQEATARRNIHLESVRLDKQLDTSRKRHQNSDEISVGRMLVRRRLLAEDDEQQDETM